MSIVAEMQSNFNEIIKNVGVIEQTDSKIAIIQAAMNMIEEVIDADDWLKDIFESAIEKTDDDLTKDMLQSYINSFL